MSKELVISANRHETRVALIEDDQLVEVYFQRANEYSLAGSIHKGRVTRVLPGMQSAFVDLGLERDTFLYVSDFLEEHEDIDRVTGDEPARPGRSGRDRDRDRERRPPQARPRSAGRNPRRQRLTRPHSPRAAVGSSCRSSSRRPRSVSGRPPDDRGDDRRGRRSRRRRNRGRGFPDSKYAAEPSAPVRAGPPAEAPAPAAAVGIEDGTAGDAGRRAAR